MFLTVLNKSIIEGNDYRSVPFERVDNGAIKILSSNPLDTEENCTVALTKKFYEFSVDWDNHYEKTGVAG